MAAVFAALEFDDHEFSVSIDGEEVDAAAAVFPLRELFSQDQKVVANQQRLRFSGAAGDRRAL
jgi:hypothetical protein